MATKKRQVVAAKAAGSSSRAEPGAAAAVPSPPAQTKPRPGPRAKSRAPGPRQGASAAQRERRSARTKNDVAATRARPKTVATTATSAGRDADAPRRARRRHARCSRQRSSTTTSSNPERDLEKNPATSCPPRLPLSPRATRQSRHALRRLQAYMRDVHRYSVSIPGQRLLAVRYRERRRRRGARQLVTSNLRLVVKIAVTTIERVPQRDGPDPEAPRPHAGRQKYDPYKGVKLSTTRRGGFAPISCAHPETTGAWSSWAPRRSAQAVLHLSKEKAACRQWESSPRPRPSLPPRPSTTTSTAWTVAVCRRKHSTHRALVTRARANRGSTSCPHRRARRQLLADEEIGQCCTTDAEVCETPRARSVRSSRKSDGGRPTHAARDWAPTSA